MIDEDRVNQKIAERVANHAKLADKIVSGLVEDLDKQKEDEAIDPDIARMQLASGFSRQMPVDSLCGVAAQLAWSLAAARKQIAEHMCDRPDDGSPEATRAWMTRRNDG